MAPITEQITQLERFFQTSQFGSEGALITDLDGTAVHEFEGRAIIHYSVEAGLKKLYDLGRPVIINTLRFPISVIKTFGKEWWKISNSAIPVILLNGSQLGYLTKMENGFGFEQLVAFPLASMEIQSVLDGVKRLMEAKVSDFILFYYPENWEKGEIIWTPLAEKIPYLQDKYKSASSVISTPGEKLAELLHQDSICMIFLLIEIPQDQLMAYQHTKRSNFITRAGVDKLTGARQMAKELKFSLEDSIGAGDSEMDTFLNGVGLSLHIGNPSLTFQGQRETIKVPGFIEYGHLLHRLAEMGSPVIK
jgi:hydroxymethylpyrimidine pyrophosphatase-like HAD family hydrolase